MYTGQARVEHWRPGGSLCRAISGGMALWTGGHAHSRYTEWQMLLNPSSHGTQSADVAAAYRAPSTKEEVVGSYSQLPKGTSNPFGNRKAAIAATPTRNQGSIQRDDVVIGVILHQVPLIGFT